MKGCEIVDGWVGVGVDGTGREGLERECLCVHVCVRVVSGESEI